MDFESSPSSEEKFIFNNHAKESLKKMKALSLEKKLTDVVLVASGLEVPAHRIVLSSASDYFHAMFTNDLLEANMNTVSLEDTDPNALKALVDFCYSGEIQLSEDNVETILSTANALQINAVVRACCDFLASRLHPSNCIGFSIFSQSQGCMDLHKVSYAYVMDNFMDVISNQEFKALSADEVRKLLSSDVLNIPSEQEAFDALMCWINHDPENRKEFLPYLLEMIRLPLLSPQQLIDGFEMYPLLKDHACQNLIMEAMKFHLLPERRSLLHSPRTKPRKSTVGSLFMIGGMDGVKGTSKIDKYDLRSNKWSDFGSLTTKRLQFGAAIIDNKLYVVGGRDGLKTLNIVECFDFKTNMWIAMPSMSTHRHGLGVGVLGGPMYAVGGHDGWTYLSAVERWDPSSRQWTYVSPLNTQRSTAGVGVLNNKLYAVGGRDGSSCLRSVECFDPHRNKWTYCAPMSIRRGGAGVGVIDNYLFALGGHHAPILNPGTARFSCVERYDPRTDTWTLVAPMKIGRDAIGIGVLGTRLVAVGGYDGQSYVKTVEAYDPQTNVWEELEELEEGRAGGCVVVFNTHGLETEI